ncbi:hypothetical protein GWK47_050277 [Chionoecetes opilio]|uniref:Uncharacterized protein n=1 Tax=Chionoecetes opilio TaxID=41210 RepID=A0A8J4Y2R5_CHIOP|nr:hypothetical protein GWK47_050277 [Chionoecetes opilio]
MEPFTLIEQPHNTVARTPGSRHSWQHGADGYPAALRLPFEVPCYGTSLVLPSREPFYSRSVYVFGKINGFLPSPGRVNLRSSQNAAEVSRTHPQPPIGRLAAAN